ncbi:MAG TPA: serine/threonine-protein kinase [Gemmataceae bacterium]|nr:serine/threonine-protein kinase [Gemmataceae bacterium]
MPDPDRLMDLLVEWDARRRAGRDVTAAELCPDDPELQRALHARLEKRRKLQAYLNDPGSTVDGRERGTDPVPAVPGYEIERVLGSGGMGVVYLARDTRLDRPVALKMVRYRPGPPNHDDWRFESEGVSVAALQHPNIVQIYETGWVGGQPYLAFEYVPGGTLAQHLEARPVPPRRAAELMVRLAEAVGHAHQKGVIHRDLKPANVLLTAAGEPKVADFGLAKRLHADGGHTQTGAILGSPCYMAPEQAEGRAAAVGPATDVYALGTVLYEMLTGRPPFNGTSVLEIIDHVRTLDPVPPKDLQPEVPTDLQTVCLKCLAKAPADRYASAAELADDLGRFLKGEPVTARPPSLMDVLLRTLRRSNYDPRFSRYATSLFIAAPVTLVLSWSFTLYFWTHPRFAEIVAWLGIVGVFVLQGFLEWYNRETLRAVPPDERRQMATVWWMHAAAMLVAWLVVWAALPADRPQYYLIVFPLWMVQVALAYFSFAADAGPFYVAGAAFAVAAVACSFVLPWAPLVTGALATTNMLAQGFSLRAMGRIAERERGAA